MVNNLKIFRIKSGLTQSDIAKLIGVSQQTYCDWESDPSKIKVRYAARLAEIFNQSLDEIFRT